MTLLKREFGEFMTLSLLECMHDTISITRVINISASESRNYLLHLLSRVF